MLAVVGTVPDPEVPLVFGEADIVQHQVTVEGRRFSVNRGTPALLAAAIHTCRTTEQPLPMAFLIGDVGLGAGSRRLYRHLADQVGSMDFDVIVFHYLQPDVDWHNRVLFAVQAMRKAPILVADAGFMYAAKMSGQAEAYDLFTPDVGELAFLADEKAPHPFYTRGFIHPMEERVPEMIARAYHFQNAARCLLVKGSRDYVANKLGVLAEIAFPNEVALEAIGGTGDTLTGIVAALVHGNMSIEQAAQLAARINRLAGHLARPTPATPVAAVIEHIPRAIRETIQRHDR